MNYIFPEVFKAIWEILGISQSEMSKNKQDHFYYYMCRIMFKGIENPDMKISDIIKLA